MTSYSRDESSNGMYLLLGAALATAAFLFFDREKRDQAFNMLGRLKDRVDSLSEDLQEKAADTLEQGKKKLKNVTGQVEQSADAASEKMRRTARQQKPS